MKNHLILLFVFFSFSGISQSAVEKKAYEDQISGKTWQALGPNLSRSINGSSDVNVTGYLVEKYNLNSRNLRSFLIYVLNYTSKELSAEKVLYRYPHYHADSIQSDLNRLLDLGLIKSKNSDSKFKITGLGNRIIKDYWRLKINQTEAYDLLAADYVQNFHQVLKKIIDDAKEIDGSKSIIVRLNSRPKNFSKLPIILQVSERLKEYTAFVNDMSHYKYDYLKDETSNAEWKKLLLSPLAMELMSATRNGRIYDLQRCYNQSNWRVGQSGCDQAVAELSRLGLVELREGQLKQSSEGAQISKFAEDLADKRRYSAWKKVTLSEYEKFVEGINWILENFRQG